jgi:hypothetical protein
MVTIEDRLTEDMHARVAGLHVPADLLAVARRRHQRRRLAVRVTTGVTLAAAVTTALATTMTGGPSQPSHRQALGQSPSPGSTVVSPGLETVAYVRQRIAQAPDPRHAIIRSTVRVAGQVNDNWMDQDSGYITDYTTEGGRLIAASRYPVTRAGRDLEIDYVARTWFARQDSAVPVDDGITGKLGEPRIDTVAGIKAAVQRSDIQIVGHGVIDGRPATHLRFVYRVQHQPSEATVTGDAWFDSQTFAPLRATTTYVSSAAPGPLPLANGAASGSATASPISETTSFLERTPSNVARTRLVVPDGFREVPAPTK